MDQQNAFFCVAHNGAFDRRDSNPADSLDTFTADLRRQPPMEEIGIWVQS